MALISYVMHRDISANVFLASGLCMNIDQRPTRVVCWAGAAEATASKE